ncbi:MAG: hypothetical protein RLZZ479_1192 [Bacteroidota bacterium]
MIENDEHIDIKNFYISNQKTGIRKEAFQFFEDKYVKNPFENYWIIEEESRFIARKINFFLPGSIYTFRYPDPITKDVLSYYDTRPMLLVMNTFLAKTTNRVILQGINLNFVPELQKVELLDTYYKVFKNNLLNAERDSDKGLIGQAKNIARYLSDWTFMTKVFVNQGKIPLTFIIRNYDITGILNPVLIEIEDWSMIPFYVPREIEGKSPAQIYADYTVFKNQTLNKNKK